MINFTVTEKEINEYSQAQPFPHIVIDNFLPPSLLNGFIDDFQNYNNWVGIIVIIQRTIKLKNSFLRGITMEIQHCQLTPS